ncbi:MAG: DUF4364 family protein [Eubacterium sp.]
MTDKEKDISKMSENEIDPRLRFDAFMAGVKDGGLRSVSSINVLVCYIVANLDGKVTDEVIVEAMDEGMIANHFEVADAISKLVKSNTVIKDENGVLSLNEKDKSLIELIEKDLPLTVRERSIKLCQKIIAKETYKRENKVEITEEKNGYTVKLHISDNDIDYMELKLFAASKDQAELIKDKFITNPVSVYNNLISSIFEN